MMERAEGAVAIDIGEAVVHSALQKLSALSKESLATDDCTIFRVPARVRQRNKLLYEPQTVAIGPFGRRDEPSLRAMEWLKWRYLQEFLSRSRSSTIKDCVAVIQEVEPGARRCYFEQVELSTEKFVEMLLLDGCFIVEFLIKWNGWDNDGLFAAEWSLPLVRGDLLLLENQIPLFVIEKLYELRTFKIDSTAATTVQRPEIPSLMELLVNYLAIKNVESPNEEVEGNNNRAVIVFGEAKEFPHLLHLYYHCYVTKPQTDPKGRQGKRSPRTIPSATELLEAGVTIKKKKKNQNQNRHSSFLDVTFSDGVLEIPFLSVENSTLPRFSNLVAFEQCSRCKPEEAYMTSYAVFMDCLIDTPGDVAILHKRGILENKLASDEELAVFFNKLSDWATLDYDNHYLAGLFREVGEYCDSVWPKWRAKLVRDYFSNPWAIISLIAAVVVLVLTFLQTFYTIFSYNHPRNPLLSPWELPVSDLA